MLIEKKFQIKNLIYIKIKTSSGSKIELINIKKRIIRVTVKLIPEQ